MTNGGDAAEQLIRVSLTGTEIVLRLTGTAAKELAVFLAAALKNPDRKKEKRAAKHGETRLATMLQYDTQIFSIKEADLEKFVKSAKNYGILYCAVKNPKDCPDNLCDLMIKASDAPKIHRMAERYGFTTLSKATVEHERERTVREASEPPAPNRDTAEDLVSDLMGEKRDKAAPQKKEPTRQDPSMATMEHPRPSAPFYADNSKSARGTFDSERPSVREGLREIKEERARKKPDAPVRDDRRTAPQVGTTHRQPPKSKNHRRKSR